MIAIVNCILKSQFSSFTRLKWNVSQKVLVKQSSTFIVLVIFDYKVFLAFTCADWTLVINVFGLGETFIVDPWEYGREEEKKSKITEITVEGIGI